MVASEDEPATLFELDPRTTLGTEIASHPLYSQLINLDNNFNPVPDLADSWTVSSDGLTYTFKLNPNAVWSDGQPVTADDVVTSLSLRKTLQFAPFFATMSSIAPKDPHTVVITLTTPNPELLVDLGDGDNGTQIQPKHFIDQDPAIAASGDTSASTLNTLPVGSGPFIFKDWVKGDHIELVRNPHYFKPGLPCLDRLIIKFASDPNARTVAFERREIDVMYSYLIPLQNVSSYRSQPSRYQVVPGGLGTMPTDFLVYNLKDKYFGDPQVRQAVAYAIDRNQYNQLAFFGAGRVAHSPMNSALSKWFDPRYDTYSYDVSKANQLLDAAGFPKGSNGVRFTLRLRDRPDRAFESRGADIIKSDLAQVGINVQIISADASTTYSEIYTSHDFDLAIQLRTVGPDPLALFPLIWGKAGFGGIALNAGDYTNPDLETLFKQLATATDATTQKTVWDNVQRIIMNDLPWLPLVEYPNIQLASAKVGNVVTGAVDYFGSRELLYLKQ